MSDQSQRSPPASFFTESGRFVHDDTSGGEKGEEGDLQCKHVREMTMTHQHYIYRRVTTQTKTNRYSSFVGAQEAVYVPYPWWWLFKS